jgi:hypothetical protein
MVMGWYLALVFAANPVLGLQGMNSNRAIFGSLPDATAPGLLALLLLRP